MTALDQTGHTSAFRLASRLKQLFQRSARYWSAITAGQRDLPNDPAPRIDLGELGVAQYVHDLRNHLMVMTACAERLFQLAACGEAEQEMIEIRYRGERATLLIRELLVAARPRPAVRRPVDLNEIVGGAGTTLSRLVGEGVHVDLRLSAVPVIVIAEELELERILLNLALNARDAMRSSGGVLTIETALVAYDRGAVEGLSRGRYARLAVSDTGSGMTAELQARIFEPFFTTKGTGTGLGLSSVAFTVGRLRGVVSVDSHPGRGTCLIVHLPAGR